MSTSDVVGIEFGYDSRGVEGYVLLDASCAEVGFIQSRPIDALGAALNNLVAEWKGPLTVDAVERVASLILFRVAP